MVGILLEFEQRIAAKRKELEEEEHALAVLKRSMGVSATVDEAAVSRPSLASKQLRFEDLGVEALKKRTLTDDVRDVVRQFGDNEFTVTHIEAALKQLGVVIDAKSPRARISIAAANLVEEGVVVKTYEGAGNVPNRYKLKSATNAESEL